MTYCQKVTCDTKYEDEYSTSNYHAVLARSVLAHLIITNKHNTGLNSSYYHRKYSKQNCVPMGPTGRNKITLSTQRLTQFPFGVYLIIVLICSLEIMGISD